MQISQFKILTGAQYRMPRGYQQVPMAHTTGKRTGGSRLLDVEGSDSQAQTRLVEELADAIASQASFVGRILALGPCVVNDAWIDRAIDRYVGFLQLAKEHPREMLVPTLDIDLIWHVHITVTEP